MARSRFVRSAGHERRLSRHEEIVRCLNDLAAQIGAVPFEVLLLLPSGVCEMLAERFSHAFPLSVFHADKGQGVHGARNASLTRVTGEIVAFLNDVREERP